MRLGLMLSGRLGEILLDYCLQNYQIAAVLTDKNSKGIIGRASKSDVPCFVGNPRNKRTAEFTKTYSVDLLLSINYLFIVEPDVIEWPKLEAVNFHGSLLPKYRGRTPHVWAIINNEQETGVTAHKLVEECDEGDILIQKVLPIAYEDTGADILRKFEDIYPEMVSEVIEIYSSGKIQAKKQNNEKATYFGKRTPKDGEINWSWQKERIRNWVRAQAFPYPGAFSFINGRKVIIDRIDYDELGFQYDQPNGMILTINPVRVKTPNGVVRLSEIRGGAEHIKEKTVFD